MDVNRASENNRLGRWFSKMFRDRQIIIRADGEIRYFTFTARAQIIVMAIWVVVGGAFGFTGVGYVMRGEAVVAKSFYIVRSQAAYRELLDQVTAYQSFVSGITRDLQETQSHLSHLFEQNEVLKKDLTSTEAALETTQEERDRVDAGRRSLNRRIGLLGTELTRMSTKNNVLQDHLGNLRGQLTDVEAEKLQIARARAALDNRLMSLHNDLAESYSRRQELESDVQSVRSDLRTTTLERNSLNSENDSLRRDVLNLEDNLAQIDERHRSELDAIARRALVNIQVLESVLRRTGLRLERVAPMPGGMIMGQGGPFIPYHPDLRAEANGEPEEQPALDLEILVARWEQLRDIFISVPLVEPVKKYYLSSGFGRRKDPVNRLWAMHYGLDMAGPNKQPVFATAPGKIVFAGRRPYYGRVIDIDHGNDIMTRYGHLYRIKVKRGQEVSIGDTIGLLGSSGRSTGPHVHYEVRYKDKALDPRKFLRAGKYVQAKSRR